MDNQDASLETMIEIEVIHEIVKQATTTNVTVLAKAMAVVGIGNEHPQNLPRRL